MTVAMAVAVRPTMSESLNALRTDPSLIRSPYHCIEKPVHTCVFLVELKEKKMRTIIGA